jgi:hypothetical protein
MILLDITEHNFAFLGLIDSHVLVVANLQASTRTGVEYSSIHAVFDLFLQGLS